MNINKLKTEFANSKDWFFKSNFTYCGTNAELKEPSANNLLKVLGSLNATKKASAKKLVPRNIAIKISLK